MKWISVKNSLPPVETDVLVANSLWCDIAWLEDGKWVNTDDKQITFEVTHWCKLNPPKEDA